jgi:hypothetical protein
VRNLLLVVLALGLLPTRAVPAADGERGGTYRTQVLSREIPGYRLTLYKERFDKTLYVGPWIYTVNWTLLEMVVDDLRTGQQRRVWSIYDPADSPSLGPAVAEERAWADARRGFPSSSSEPRDFTLGLRDEQRVAVAYLHGNTSGFCRFFEIDLLQEVAPAIHEFRLCLKPGPDYKPGLDPVGMPGLLGSEAARHADHCVFMGHAVVEAKGEAAVKDFGRQPIDIQSVYWAGESWQVTVKAGPQEYTFIQTGDNSDGKGWELLPE